MTTPSRSGNGRNGNGNGRSYDALDGRSYEGLAALRSGKTRRQLKNGAPAHAFTTEERRRGAERTNEIKRERAARIRETQAEPLDLAEKLYLLTADKTLLIQTFNRLSQELHCSDCGHALRAVDLVLKYLAPKAPGIGAAATAITDRIRELGFDAEAEDIAREELRRVPGE